MYMPEINKGVDVPTDRPPEKIRIRPHTYGSKRPPGDRLEDKRLTSVRIPVRKIVSVLKEASVRRNLSNFQIVVTAVSMSS